MPNQIKNKILKIEKYFILSKNSELWQRTKSTHFKRPYFLYPYFSPLYILIYFLVISRFYSIMVRARVTRICLTARRTHLDLWHGRSFEMAVAQSYKSGFFPSCPFRRPQTKTYNSLWFILEYGSLWDVVPFTGHLGTGTSWRCVSTSLLWIGVVGVSWSLPAIGNWLWRCFRIVGTMRNRLGRFIRT